MLTKKPTKIIRTDKWMLNPTDEQRMLFAETVQVYRRLCRYLVGIVLTHWPDLGRLSSNELVPAVERLIHGTLKNQAPRYALIDKVFHKFPSYYRRAAIMFASGQVSSYLTRYQDWVSGNRKRRDAKPSMLNANAGCYLLPSPVPGAVLQVA